VDSHYRRAISVGSVDELENHLDVFLLDSIDCSKNDSSAAIAI